MDRTHTLSCHLQYNIGELKQEINFDWQGQILGIYGPSGVGKSTFFHALLTLIPSTGHLSFNHEIWQSSQYNEPISKRKIGYLPQDGLLFPHMTVLKNILYASEAKPDLFPAISENLNIHHLSHRYPETLSGGEKMRVALARALIQKPKLLLLDEPLNSLDFALKQKSLALIMQMIRKYKIPTLYISHDPNELKALADHILMFSKADIRLRSQVHFSQEIYPTLRDSREGVFASN